VQERFGQTERTLAEVTSRMERVHAPLEPASQPYEATVIAPPPNGR
jgi:hypothetical protein